MAIHPTPGPVSFTRTAVYLATLFLASVGMAGSGSADEGQAPLAPCAGKPNCVCSDDPSPDHHVPPYRLTTAPPLAWKSLVALMAEWPRTRVVAASDTDLEAEVKSRVFGFVDDVAFQLRPEENIVAVRSASRSGYYDFGVNRKRVEEIRQKLRQIGAAE